MTKLSFDDGEAFTFLEGLVDKELSYRFSTVTINYDLLNASKNTKREDTQTYITFKCSNCNKKWRSGYGHIEVLFKFSSFSTVSFNTLKSDQQCNDCEVDALASATEDDLREVAERLCAKVLASSGHYFSEPAEFKLKGVWWHKRHFCGHCDACKEGTCYFDK